jgi:histidyl-tRNA synthetase
MRALQMLNDLRAAGIRAAIGFGGRSLKAQLRDANRAGASYALLLGDEEMAAGQVLLKDMLHNAPQERLGQAEIVPALLKRLC